ncbi:hypothetical protein CYMTET_28965 [Cymbomonas tetramitiformis]|uniref:Tyrosinase copper-binding domain-containing protein n=1 Tax=Cymbomonas tetramitiformis TaxID=36881 RepID=A0AAE0FLX1_9CHLO|nr:hypothetical protein CYMTET_28965 [Cymbomonas tetramitiformis]|eukprot:gene7892-9373_t
MLIIYTRSTDDLYSVDLLCDRRDHPVCGQCHASSTCADLDDTTHRYNIALDDWKTLLNEQIGNPRSYCDAKPNSRPRVRKDLSKWTDAEFDKLVDAMFVMRNTDMLRGQQLYGDYFRSYGYFVAKHVIASTDTRGDQGHYGSHFLMWHKAFLLEFENSLLAIDQSLDAVP